MTFLKTFGEAGLHKYFVLVAMAHCVFGLDIKYKSTVGRRPTVWTLSTLI